MSGRLNIAPALLDSPAAELNSPGLAVVYLTATGSYLAFTAPGAARGRCGLCPCGRAARRPAGGPGDMTGQPAERLARIRREHPLWSIRHVSEGFG